MAARKAGTASARAPTNMAVDRSRCLFMASWWIVVCLLWGPAAFANRNQFYHISQFCDRKRGLQLFRNVGGAVLSAENVTEVNCVMTFSTDSVLQKFMLRFEKFKLDCNDHLYIYDSSNAYGNYKVNLSCSHNKRNVGVIFTDGNHVTLKYVTDGWVQMGSGFKLILTAIKSLKGPCNNDFVCKNNFCIDSDLTCDGVNHCNDNSDETSYALCTVDEDTMGRVLGVEANVFIAIVVSIFVICFMCIIVVVICICRRQRHQGAGVGGNLVGSGHPNYPMQHGYPPMSGGHPEKPPPYPGNTYPPAGGIGYSTHQGNIYYPTK